MEASIQLTDSISNASGMEDYGVAVHPVRYYDKSKAQSFDDLLYNFKLKFPIQ